MQSHSPSHFIDYFCELDLTQVAKIFKLRGRQSTTSRRHAEACAGIGLALSWHR